MVVPNREGLLEIASGKRRASRWAGDRDVGSVQLNKEGMAYTMAQDKSELDQLELCKASPMQPLFAQV